MINGQTTLLGILGSNIGYSLSPAIHNFSAQSLGINAAYVPFDGKNVDTQKLLEVFWQIGIQGFNVTTPYKRLVAHSIGMPTGASINTVYRTESGWGAASTDIEGLAAAIKRMSLTLSGFKRIVILGSGGVVSALLKYISEKFEIAPEVAVLRRHESIDKTLVEHLPKTFKVSFYDFDPSIFHDLLTGAAGETLVVQGTSAPHQGDDLKRFSTSFVRFNGAFVDLVYGTKSALLDAARARGLPCQDGLVMLIEQARLAQKYWWGQSASFDSIHQFLVTNFPNLKSALA